MDSLAIQLALHGVLVLLVSIFGGLFLYRAILKNTKESAWHLLHAGGSVRGVMLIALGATIHYPALPMWQISVIAWLVIFFVWTSVLAMLLAAATGERGLHCTGTMANKAVYILYGLGTLAIFPALFWLSYGLFKAL